MKRSKYSKIGNIINILYRNTRRLISLPFRLIKLPFKLILGPVFNSNRLRIKQHRIYVNKRISSLTQQVNQNRTRYNLVMLHNGQIAQIESDIELLSKTLKNYVKILDEKFDSAVFCFKENKKDINELQLSLESMKPINLGDIEAEALGMQVAKEEKEQSRDEKYDWSREKRLLNEQMNNAE